MRPVALPLLCSLILWRASGRLWDSDAAATTKHVAILRLGVLIARGRDGGGKKRLLRIPFPSQDEEDTDLDYTHTSPPPPPRQSAAASLLPAIIAVVASSYGEADTSRVNLWVASSFGGGGGVFTAADLARVMEAQSSRHTNRLALVVTFGDDDGPGHSRGGGTGTVSPTISSGTVPSSVLVDMFFEGLTLWRTGDTDGAYQTFKRAAKLGAEQGTDLPEVHYNLGVVLRDGGRSSSSSSDEEGAGKKQRGRRVHHDGYYERLGRSLVHFARAIDLRPRYAEAHYNVAQLLQGHFKDREAEAIVHYSSALRSLEEDEEDEDGEEGDGEDGEEGREGGESDNDETTTARESGGGAVSGAEGGAEGGAERGRKGRRKEERGNIPQSRLLYRCRTSLALLLASQGRAAEARRRHYWVALHVHQRGRRSQLSLSRRWGLRIQMMAALPAVYESEAAVLETRGRVGRELDELLREIEHDKDDVEEKERVKEVKDRDAGDEEEASVCHGNGSKWGRRIRQYLHNPLMWKRCCPVSNPLQRGGAAPRSLPVPHLRRPHGAGVPRTGALPGVVERCCSRGWAHPRRLLFLLLLLSLLLLLLLLLLLPLPSRPLRLLSFLSLLIFLLSLLISLVCVLVL